MPLAWPNSLSMVINHTQGKTKSLAEILSLLSLPPSLPYPSPLSKWRHHSWFQPVRTLSDTWLDCKRINTARSWIWTLNEDPLVWEYMILLLHFMTVHLKWCRLQGHFHFSHNVLNETLACKTGSLVCKIILYWMAFIQSGNQIFSRQFLYFLKIQLCLIASYQLFCLEIIKINGGGGLQEWVQK